MNPIDLASVDRSNVVYEETKRARAPPHRVSSANERNLTGRTPSKRDDRVNMSASYLSMKCSNVNSKETSSELKIPGRTLNVKENGIGTLSER
ncbi:hypothetical protein TNCT_188031 [Trichonephila clavata]|uniref:Uncharacterized protein n=1 Tax=Trichonephila clavata TaxID=2740835 RepID=A0A8X6H0P2_TRICU|nr:hypothetical protein TNCT_188031 [Trichonephila clavata]